MQYVQTPQLDKGFIKPKTTSIQTQRHSYLIPGQRQYGSEQQPIQGRGSFNMYESFQEDILMNDTGRNPTKKLLHGSTFDQNNSGGEFLLQQNNQYINQAPKKTISKQNPPIKKKGLQLLQQQVVQKFQGVNLVNLNLNLMSNVQSQLPPSYPLMKNQENLQVQNDNTIKKKKVIQQQEPIYNSMKGPQSNFIPNRLQKIQTVASSQSTTKSSIIQAQQNFDEIILKSNIIDQSTGLYVVDLNQASSNLINSINTNNKNLIQNLQKASQSPVYQVQEIIPINEKNCDAIRSESPIQKFSNLGSVGQNDFQQKMPCNHKKKIIKEINNSSQIKAMLMSNELKNGRYESNVMDPAIASQERIELNNSASKMLQLKNKSKGTLEMKKSGIIEIQDSNNQRQKSQEYYDDAQLFSQNSNTIIKSNNSKNKQFYQQQQKGGSIIISNQNNIKNNFYNGIRNEPSSHQFVALKNPENDDKLRQSSNSVLQPMSQIAEAEQEQSQELIRNSFVYQRNQIIPLSNRRQVSNSETREYEQNSIDYQDNMKQFGINSMPFQIQKKELLSYKNYRTLQNQGTLEQDQIQQACDYLNVENMISQPLQDNKKANRKIINANPQSKQDINKRYSGIMVTSTTKQKASTEEGQNNVYMTLQQKQRLQKNEKENIIQMKIKIFLDFQRIINFSNNMTMQPPLPNGGKVYKAYITKGNNGVLIRACLKNRWWWTLSESSDDYENINFLWTQWRKPNFYKLIQSRSQLSLNAIKADEMDTVNESIKLSSSQAILQLQNFEQQQQDQSENNSQGSQNQIGEKQPNNQKEGGSQEQICGDFVELPDNTQEDQIDTEKQNIDLNLPTTNERNGYNEASPSKNLQDYIIKYQTNSKRQSQGSKSPPQIRKFSQQIQQDSFASVAALVNGKDLEIIKGYIKDQKKKKQIPNSFIPPPIFNKEEYEEGIEKEYQQMRQGTGVQINTFKNPMKQKMHNHMEYNFHLANKKALYYNMKAYYTIINKNVFDHLPVTFHIQNGINDPEFNNFVNYYNKFEAENPKRKNVWIIKPGESSNRGNGIQVAGDLNSVRDIIKVRDQHQNGFKKTYIIQKYLDRPFLYNKRKFDIRCFMLMTNYNNTMKAYWYTDGYIRTSTKEFTLKNLENRMIHLTNEAVQKRGDDFGKYENGNKLSYAELQKYIDITHPKENFNFMSQVYPQMKQLAYDSVCSVYTKIDKKKRNFSFEFYKIFYLNNKLFGLDFMIDENFKTWLIEINTNPSLTIAAPLMSRLLPALVDNVIKIAIDPIFPPPNFPKSKKHLIPEQLYENNKFELLFDSDVDGERINQLYQNISKKIDEQLEEDCKNEEVYDDDDAEVDQEDEENDEEEGC